ncbi:hypothetical protein J5X84_14070 [Streptosporangiaceae bacterium NEAU-GS5]|nr:hypothetical protein [Streptosporangiaceae bacterium NEAU-GS5]
MTMRPAVAILAAALCAACSSAPKTSAPVPSVSASTQDALDPLAAPCSAVSPESAEDGPPLTGDRAVPGLTAARLPEGLSFGRPFGDLPALDPTQAATLNVAGYTWSNGLDATSSAFREVVVGLVCGVRDETQLRGLVAGAKPTTFRGLPAVTWTSHSHGDGPFIMWLARPDRALFVGVSPTYRQQFPRIAAGVTLTP